MLKNTFRHLPGIDSSTESRLWASGICCWEDALNQSANKVHSSLARHLEDSFDRLSRHDSRYFSDALPPQDHWRLFPELRQTVAYVDIETTGLGQKASITTIALYDGQSVQCYVQGENLSQFPYDVRDYQLLISYNGKAFDVPFIERFFGTKLHHAHIDLMHVLRSLGYTGGLKGCERKLGLDRKELTDVDGYFAVMLWQEYQRSKNPKAIETLLAYNVQDVVNLETLMVKAYNMKLKSTPFAKSLKLSESEPAVSPYKADLEVIAKLKRRNPSRYFSEAI